jgi:dienelactone hydrolase
MICAEVGAAQTVTAATHRNILVNIEYPQTQEDVLSTQETDTRQNFSRAPSVPWKERDVSVSHHGTADIGREALVEHREQPGRRTAIRVFACASLTGFQLPMGLCPEAEPVADAEAMCFVDGRKVRHQLYAFGASGPPVILLHELPGLVREDVAAARRLAAAGYRVITPLFFGRPDQRASAWTTTLNALRVCDAGEFACGARRRTSPHAIWLRELIISLSRDRCRGQGVSVIGMCLTGALPIALLQPPVVAAVVCQPTLPFHLFTRFGWFTDKSGLGVSEDDLTTAKTASESPILGIRYTRDWRCRPERFTRLAREFGDRFYRLDIAGDGHSTLGADCQSTAFDEVVAFLGTYARGDAPGERRSFPRLSRRNARDPVPVHSTAACMPHHASGGR